MKARSWKITADKLFMKRAIWCNCYFKKVKKLYKDRIVQIMTSFCRPKKVTDILAATTRQ